MPAVGLVGKCLSQSLGAGLAASAARGPSPGVDCQACGSETTINKLYSASNKNNASGRDTTYFGPQLEEAQYARWAGKAQEARAGTRQLEVREQLLFPLSIQPGAAAHRVVSPVGLRCSVNQSLETTTAESPRRFQGSQAGARFSWPGVFHQISC